MIVWILLSLGVGSLSITPVGFFSSLEDCERVRERISIELSHTAVTQCIKARVAAP